jgi:hypothetical protein
VAFSFASNYSQQPQRTINNSFIITDGNLANVTTCGLQPATLYNFSVAAAVSASTGYKSFGLSDFGIRASITVWTELSYRPDSPVVVSVSTSSAVFRLSKFQIDQSVAVVTDYTVVVIRVLEMEGADELLRPTTWFVILFGHFCDPLDKSNYVEVYSMSAFFRKLYEVEHKV